MRAIIRDGVMTSPTATTGEVDNPNPCPDRLLVRPLAVGITAMETHWLPTWKKADGSARSAPVILGHEFAGEVLRAGENVADYKPGDRVIGHIRPYDDGACAALVSVHPQDVVSLPAPLDPRLASVLPLAGLTAWQALFDHGRLEKGQKVLIHGGAGGVGHLAVQLAKWHGAEVITTCGPNDLEFCRAIGADLVIDYTQDRFEDLANEVDLVLDTIGGDTQERSWKVIRRGGTLVTIAGEKEDAPSQERAERQGIRALFFIVTMDRNQLQKLIALQADGHLHPVVDRLYAFDEVLSFFEGSDFRSGRGKAIMLPLRP